MYVGDSVSSGGWECMIQKDFKSIFTLHLFFWSSMRRQLFTRAILFPSLHSTMVEHPPTHLFIRIPFVPFDIVVLRDDVVVVGDSNASEW